MKQAWLFLLGLLFYSIAANAQGADSGSNKYWIDGGFGVFESSEDINGFTSGVSVNLIKKSTLYKFRFLESKELRYFGSDPIEEMKSSALMIGRGFSSKYAQIYFSAGVGITSGVTVKNYIGEKFTSPSLAWEIDLQLKPIEYLGLGIALFGDYQMKRPMHGVLVKIGVGKYR